MGRAARRTALAPTKGRSLTAIHDELGSRLKSTNGVARCRWLFVASQAQWSAKGEHSGASSKLEPLRRAEGEAASNASVLSGKMPGHSRIPPPEPPAKDAKYAGAGSASAVKDSASSNKDSSSYIQDSTRDSASHPHRTSVPLTTAAERMPSKSRHGEEQLADNGARLPSSAPHEAEKAKGSTTEGHVKVSTMDKIKGEAKIISGKLSHKEEKVEEGRKLMGKV